MTRVHIKVLDEIEAKVCQVHVAVAGDGARERHAASAPHTQVNLPRNQLGAIADNDTVLADGRVHASV
jgi:hypothetical protein